MRFEGVLTSWNDDRGFGFIKSPKPGGKDVFVHISAFPQGRGRPTVGQRLSYELLDERGKPRAAAVALVGPDRLRQVQTFDESRLPNKASLAAIALLAGVYLWLDGRWGVSELFPALYLGASVVTFIAYAIDKNAAQRGGWRISEKTLLLFGLAFGWPGAIRAQVLLRHKSQKTSFRLAFWFTVLLNLFYFAYLCSPQGALDSRQDRDSPYEELSP